jgi:hypothetical protein
MARHGEIGVSTTERELREDIERRVGRISLLNALKAVAERSTSHADAARIATEQPRAHGAYFKPNQFVESRSNEAIPT